jgi:hypothetical protein
MTDDVKDTTAESSSARVTQLATLFDEVAARFEAAQGRPLDAEGRRRVAARIVAVTRQLPAGEIDEEEICETVLIYIRAFEIAAALAPAHDPDPAEAPAPRRSLSGATYDPDAVAAMTAALDRCLDELPDRLPSSVVTTLSAAILAATADGERDVAALAAQAMDRLRQRR